MATMSSAADLLGYRTGTICVEYFPEIRNNSHPEVR